MKHNNHLKYQIAKIFYFLFVFFIFNFYFLLSPITSHAQVPTSAVPLQAPPAGINLSVSPTFLNLTTDPGTPVESQFKVKNNSNFTERLRVRLAKFEIGEGGKPLLSPISANDQFAQWVDIPESEFSVSSNQTQTVKFTINPPKEASLGYYYAFVIERVQERSGEGQQAIVTGSPALLTLLEVRSPNAKRELQLLDFKTSRMWYEYLPAEFIITVKNTGNVHIVPTGNIFIDQGGTKDLAILGVNTSRGNILPQTERDFPSEWAEGFAVREARTENGQIMKNDKGETQYTVKYDFQKADKFRIGKYTANLLMVYDNGERDVPLEASISFWVIPWKIIGVGLIVVAFVLLGVRSTVMSMIGRVKKK